MRARTEHSESALMESPLPKGERVWGRVKSLLWGVLTWVVGGGPIVLGLFLRGGGGGGPTIQSIHIGLSEKMGARASKMGARASKMMI